MAQTVKNEDENSGYHCGLSDRTMGRPVVECGYDESKMFNNATFLEYVESNYSEFSCCYTDGSRVDGAEVNVASGKTMELGFAFRLHS